MSAKHTLMDGIENLLLFRFLPSLSWVKVRVRVGSPRTFGRNLQKSGLHGLDWFLSSQSGLRDCSTAW